MGYPCCRYVPFYLLRAIAFYLSVYASMHLKNEKNAMEAIALVGKEDLNRLAQSGQR